VADAAAQREDAAITFARIRDLVDGEARTPRPTAPHPRRAPRLTEAWFC